jgi:serine/threonine-protein kinase
MPTHLGRYEVQAKIAEGGMATVYLGRLAGPAGFERVVALKVIRDQYALNPDFVDMFLDEAKIVARLSHPNIVQVHELGMEGNRLFIAMELLFGQSLWQVWEACRERKVRLRYDLMAWLGARVAEGLHHAHELTDAGQKLEVIHRDVNPSNIFVTYDGQPKVIDFGLAKAANRISKTAAGVLKGKLAYMSPEQALGQRIDRRTDVFALGTTLWELTVDRRLFKQADDVSTLKAVHEALVPDPRTLVMGYPEQLWRVLSRALQRDRDARYPTALDMARELDACSRMEGRVVSSATMAEVMLALFAHESERQARWIAEASGGGEAARRDTMRPPPGTPLPGNTGMPHRRGVFAEVDPDAPTLYFVPKDGEVLRLEPSANPRITAPPPTPPIPPAPGEHVRAEVAQQHAPALPAVTPQAVAGPSNQPLWIAVGVLSLLLVAVMGMLAWLLATR